MNTNLLSNRELDDYVADDSFDFLIKAEAIKSFLEFNFTSLEKNKMIVLYGDWGSGKTSLMRHIESTIDRNIYCPIFFQAWEHEKDENLPLSLCDELLNSLDSNDEIVKNFMKGAITTLKSFTSGITLKSSGVLSGLGIDFEFSGEKVIDAIDKAYKKPEKLSFYKSNKEFKESFKQVEELLLKKYNAQKLLIFVDDLDRCEPENVLNLITALKLFFSFGDKTVYFSGIDKDAVTKAVKTRYKDVIKSEEYMEKVFDISFNMPKTFSLEKILLPYFFKISVKNKNAKTYVSTDVVEDFFTSINFTNPRHIKKVLNKYQIILAFQSADLTGKFRYLIPEIITSHNTGKIFETIYCLLIIILYEFNPEEFVHIADYEKKFINYIDVFHEHKQRSVVTSAKASAAIEMDSILYLENIQDMTFNEIIKTSNGKSGGDTGFGRFLLLFSIDNPSSIGFLPEQSLNDYNQYFTDNSISTNFCKFLIKHKETITFESEDSNYKIGNLFKMAKYLL